MGVSGDFSILAEVQSSTTTYVGITLLGQPATGTEFWQGLQRLDIGYGNSNFTIFYWMGSASAPVAQSFPYPGGRPAGPARIEVARVGRELIFYGGGIEAGRIPDPGLFSNDYVMWGAIAGASTTVTLTDLRAAVPTASPDTTLLSFARARVARSQNGTALRDFAAERGLLFGTEMAPEGLSTAIQRNTLGREFNSLVTGNAMKFDALHPAATRYTFCGADAAVTFAETNHMKVRGHVLLWHSQIPGWLANGTFTPVQVRAIMQDHIGTVVDHFKGRIAWWDVVNEALVDTAPNGLRATLWSNALGPNYIDDAFRLANAADPDVKLFYNDYGVEGINSKSTAMYTMVQGMLSRGVPIHGVGLQAHLRLASPTRQSMTDNIKRFGDLGLDVHITELDVALPAPSTSATLASQATIYRDVVAACNAHPRCTLVTTWGISDATSWIDAAAPGFTDPLMFDRQYAQKPSYASTVDEIKKRPLKPMILDGGAIIHAGLTNDVSPGSLADIYGARMATSTVTASFGAKLPTTLGGVQVLVKGVPVPLLYVSPDFIIMQIPYETPIGIAQVSVVANGVPTISAPFKVKAAAPMILTYGANLGVVQNSDYSTNSPSNCAKAGSFIIAYLMGSGPLDGAVATGEPVPGGRVYAQLLPTTATLGTVNAPVLFAGMTPGLYGLMQVNITVPQGVSGNVELQIGVGSEVTNRPLVCVTP